MSRIVGKQTGVAGNDGINSVCADDNSAAIDNAISVTSGLDCHATSIRAETGDVGFLENSCASLNGGFEDDVIEHVARNNITVRRQMFVYAIEGNSAYIASLGIDIGRRVDDGKRRCCLQGLQTSHLVEQVKTAGFDVVAANFLAREARAIQNKRLNALRGEFPS